VAVFGVVMAHAFSEGLESRLRDAKVPAETQQDIRNQETKLAAIEIPQKVAGAQREAAKRAVDESFLQGFRLVMVLGAALSVLSSVCAWLTLSSRSRPN
jgi:hypothetical protein